MSDFLPKAGAPAVRGLGPKAQKLQAMREKAERLKAGDGSKSHADAGASSSKTASGFKKTAFQRKSV